MPVVLSIPHFSDELDIGIITSQTLILLRHHVDGSYVWGTAGRIQVVHSILHRAAVPPPHDY